MVGKIFRTGNDLVVSVPSETLEVLGLGEEAEVSVEVDQKQRRIVITPAGRSLAGVDEDFARQITEFIDQYRPGLEALAKG